MRLRSKLGEAQSTERLVLLVLILVTTAVVLYFLVGVREIIMEEADGACAAELRKADFIHKTAGSEFVPQLEKCQTESKHVANSDLPRGEAAQDEAMKRLLAEEMRTCWEEWGKGDLELFDESGEYCHFCTIVYFDEDHGTLQNFNGYLHDTKAPTGETYENILQGKARNADISGENLDVPPHSVPANKDQPLAVMFWYSKNRATSSVLERMTGTELGATTSTAIGTSGIIVAGGYLMWQAQKIPLIGNVISNGIGGVTFGTVTLAYMHVRKSEQWYTLSATYLTPYNPDNYYVQQCERKASVDVSP